MTEHTPIEGPVVFLPEWHVPMIAEFTQYDAAGEPVRTSIHPIVAVDCRGRALGWGVQGGLVLASELVKGKDVDFDGVWSNDPELCAMGGYWARRDVAA